MIDLFWKKLSEVQSFEYMAYSDKIEDQKWLRKGQGTVQITKNDSQSIIFYEKGTWSDLSHENMSFTNTYRWTLEKELKAILVSQERRGKEQQVILVRLVPKGNQLISEEKHFCGEDVYSASLRFNSENNLELNWEVSGPSKKQRIKYEYLDTDRGCK